MPETAPGALFLGAERAADKAGTAGVPSFFTDVRVVGPVGDDFGDPEYAVLRERGVNTDDIERVRAESLARVAAAADQATEASADHQPRIGIASRQFDQGRHPLGGIVERDLAVDHAEVGIHGTN